MATTIFYPTVLLLYRYVTSMSWVHPKLSQQQVVGEDTDHGWASVGVLTDRNQGQQFGINPMSSLTIVSNKLNYII